MIRWYLILAYFVGPVVLIFLMLARNRKIDKEIYLMSPKENRHSLNRKDAIKMMSYKLLFFLLLPTCIFYCSGCKKDSEHDLVGNYAGWYNVMPKISVKDREGIYHGGQHFLELRSDGTYLYTYKPTNGEQVATSNTWTLEYYNGESEVVLTAFALGASQQNVGRPGFVHFNVDRTPSGKILLTVDYDFEYYLSKQE